MRLRADKKEKRQREAIERAQTRAKRGDAGQLEHLDSCGHAAKKERERLRTR